MLSPRLCIPTCQESTPKTPNAMAAMIVISWERKFTVRDDASGVRWQWHIWHWVLLLGDMVDIGCISFKEILASDIVLVGWAYFMNGERERGWVEIWLCTAPLISPAAIDTATDDADELL